MNVHFIAIGGSAMHNMAIAMHKKGFNVSGSDDEILEPSKSRLAAHQLLPSAEGWNVEKINDKLDAVILGMHARADNPELIKAQQLGLKIYSYPEYITPNGSRSRHRSRRRCSRRRGLRTHWSGRVPLIGPAARRGRTVRC